MAIRKTQFVKETVHAEAGEPAPAPIRRVAALAVIDNPVAGRYERDLSHLFDVGLRLGEELMPEAVRLLDGPALVYGKAAIVGVNGDLEHAAALCHPKMGKPVRAALGGGEALIPSTQRVAAAGASLDLPLGHKDNAWSFEHFETVTVCVPDAPRPDEIVVAIGIADGGRVNPRVGKARIL